ncbi:MAG: ABC transporter permease [Coriobacteriia bacterium]|nr:ABC transporter permease [Coriobacteriia bacterium]
MYEFRRILAADLQNLFTNPMWLVTSTVYPAALILVLGFLASGSYGQAVTSYDYYGVAMLLYLVFNVATFSANSFMEERIKSPNMRIVYSPIPAWFIHLSKVLATTVFCSVSYGLVAVVLHLTLGINYGGAGSWAFAALVFLSILFFSAFGVLVCCLLKSEGSANQLVSLLVTVFAVLGGLFFPVDGLGRAVAVASWASPAKWILVASLRIIYDGDLALLAPAAAILGTLTLACVLASSRIFRGEEYL